MIVKRVLAPMFAIGAQPNGSPTGLCWATLSCHCVSGQALPVILLHPIVADGAGRSSGDDWSTVLVACGLWHSIKEHALPSWLLPDEAVTKLSEMFDSRDDFRRALARLSVSEPEPPSIG